MRTVVAVLLGLVCGMVAVALLQTFSALLYPPPEDLDFTDRAAMAAWIEELPVGAFVTVLVSHAAGACVGGLVCSLIMGRQATLGILIIGVFFLTGGVVNLATIPHPRWFAVVDLLLYLPAAVAGGWIGNQLRGRATEESSAG